MKPVDGLAKRIGVEIVVGLVVGWFLLPSRSTSSTSSDVVDAMRTGTMPRLQWDEEHVRAARAAAHAIGVPAAAVDRVVRAWVAHWVTETGRTSEWNFNVANLHRGSWRGPVYVLPGERANIVYQRAYRDLVEGATDYASTIELHYGGALQRLIDGGSIEDYYRDVRASGWTAHPAPQHDVDSFNAIAARVPV